MITTTDYQVDTKTFIREAVATSAVVQQTVIIGRWGIRAAINYIEKRPVPISLSTPLLLVSRKNVDDVDMSGVRAPMSWTPPTK